MVVMVEGKKKGSKEDTGRQSFLSSIGGLWIIPMQSQHSGQERYVKIQKSTTAYDTTMVTI
jgi:hypothetical protein